ncbi:hypothetical protein BGZ93_002504 [Podila epicladia]|nr:hypothetical protein BGZ92_009928 [Podila epicladia]KAG0097529.1 hypothetical protein BGZ93_002504 [Podila epicladia]
MEEHNQLAATLPDSSSSIPESTVPIDTNAAVDTTSAQSQPDQHQETLVLQPSSNTTEAAEAIAKLPEHDLRQYAPVPVRESTPTPKDIEAVSEVTSQAFSTSFSQETADDIKALTNALTTPMATHSETHDAVAATVAALSATVAAASSSVENAADAHTDSNHLINQVLSIVNAQPKTNKRTADQEMYDQNQAAQALQSIAQSLSNLGNLEPTEPTEDISKSESKIPAESTSSHMEGVQSTNTDTTTTATGPSVAESLMAISQAINFPTQSDSTAFAQAILNATQAEVAKKSDGTTDQSTLQTLNFPTDNKDVDSTTIPTTTAPSNTGQAFTFEVDKVTGKTQLKWSEEPSAGGADSTLTEQANATLQAFHSLLVSSGIAGLADLTGSGSTLLAPPIGAFPAQGSQFGTAQDPPVPEPAAQPPRKKKKTTSTSNGQNTAASIPEGATSYPCTHEGCDKVFARLYNLKSHQRTHTNERNFVCNTCAQAFARNHDLKRHVKIHGGDKPFKCNGCGKSFSRLDALGRHRGNSKNRAGCASVETPAES